jgi:hypothetical protein
MRAFALLAVISISVSSAHASKWSGANDPAIMDGNFVYELARLPIQGELPRRPWSETYWASAKGSINIRWNLAEPEGFGYHSPGRAELLGMDPASRLAYLKTLAPSEKYDIFMGRYDYPLREEVSGIATPRARWWSGICDGWSIAASQFAEPQPITLTNADGIEVPFGSSDIKGLMAFHAMMHFKTPTKQVGLRCFGVGKIFGSAGCSDINPGALHVILANRIGLQQKQLIVERDPGHQIWNQPVYGFQFHVLGSASPEEGARGVHVRGTLFYTDELEQSQWEPVTGTKNFVEGKIQLDYILDLDNQGRIIGGSWLDGSDRPDFVWFPTETFKFGSEMEGLNRIYKPVGTP